MNNLILCEGTTDLLLMQFVLQYKYNWSYDGFMENTMTNRLVKRKLKKDSDRLEIQACGGITEIPKELCNVRDKMINAMYENELYDNVIILIDHDTVGSNREFVKSINEKIGTSYQENDLEQWIEWRVKNVLEEINVNLYIKSIPEEGTGAIENVMFSALNTDEIEEQLIAESKSFITAVSNRQEKYLKSKSRQTKAAFNTYFAIRTPEEKYDERARILKAFNWNDNEVLQQSFSFLGELSE